MKSRISILLLVTTAAVILFALSSQQEIGTPPLYALTATHQPKTVTAKPTTTLIAVGDIMLSRYVEDTMKRKDDWSYPFRATAALTKTGDIVFGNLETPLINGPAVLTDELFFRADPRSVEGLSAGGFTVISLANNHMKNKGTDGIVSTVEALDTAKIAHVGAGLNAAEASRPVVIAKNGIRFGFLAYVDPGITPASYRATETQSGSPFMEVAAMAQDVAQLKTSADVIIVSMHAGVEYADQPSARQKEFARAAITAGASLVIGHHPHVVQPLEQYRGGYILYSLGNFIFDQMQPEAARASVIATITFTGRTIKQPTFTPVQIFEYNQPRIVSETAGAPILARLHAPVE